MAINALADASSATGTPETLTTGAFTPTANAQLYAFFIVENNSHAVAHTHAVTSTGGLSWSAVPGTPTALQPWNADGNFASRAGLWTATVGGSPSSITVTVDGYSTANQAYYAMQVFEDTDASAIVSGQIAIASAAKGGGASETQAVSLPSNATNGNTVIVGFAAPGDTAGACATPSGFTPVGTPQSAPACHVGVFTRIDFTTATVTCTDLGEAVGAGHGIVIELVAAGPQPEREQEGFRWRNDDGSETTATWKAAQDTNLTAPLSANARLRMLVDTTLDAASAAYTLRYQKSGDGAYVAVPVGASTTQIAPVIEGTAESAVTTAGTSHAITLPASIVSTDLVLILMDIGSTSATLNSLTDWGEVLDESAANGLKILRYTGTGVPSNPTFTSSAATKSASIAYRISGADKTVTPQIGTTATGTSATPDPPSVTPTGGVSQPYLFIAFFGSAGEEADDDTWVNTPPTNYLPNPPLQKTAGTAGTNLGGLIGAASRTNTSGSAENPGTFGIDVSAAWRAQTIIVHPTPVVTNRVYVATSANVTAGGEATTAQLTAPAGKTTSDFTTGRMWDDENGTDSIDVAADFYTELEWVLRAQSPAVDTDVYQFRVYSGAVALDTYTVTPEWTIGTGGTDGTATPGVIAAAVTVPAPTKQAGTVTSPAVIARTVAIPQAAASAETSATATPAVIARAVALPAPTVAGGAGASPAVIARTVALPAPTLTFGATPTPAVIARTVTIPAATASGGTAGNAAPAVIARTVTLPAATTQAGSRPTPAVISVARTIPAATASGSKTATPAVIPLAVFFETANVDSSAGVDVIPLAVSVPQVAATGGGSATALPAVIARAVTLPAPTVSGAGNVAPSVIARSLALPFVTTQGGSAGSPAVIVTSVALPASTVTAGATPTPAVIPLAVTIPQATGSGASAGTATPAVTALVVALAAPTVTGAGNTAPAVIALAVTIPQATGTGASPGTATPAVIDRTVTIPQVTPMFGWTVTPTVIALSVTLPQATGQASKTTTPAVIARAVVIPQATASGATSVTATPATVVLTVVLPAATLQYGWTATPAALALAVFLPSILPPFVLGTATSTLVAAGASSSVVLVSAATSELVGAGASSTIVP